MRISVLKGSVVRALALAVALSACGAGSAFSPSDQESEPAAAPQFAKQVAGAAAASPTYSSYSASLLPSTSHGSLDELIQHLTTLLPCSPEMYRSTSATIGSKGGTVVIGSHRLLIPMGALTNDVKITGEVVTGRVNSVRLSPHGLEFAKPVTLIMSYSNCNQIVAPKAIVYTDEQLAVLKKLKSADAPKAFEVAAPLDHFSRYAIAW